MLLFYWNVNCESRTRKKIGKATHKNKKTNVGDSKHKRSTTKVKRHINEEKMARKRERTK